MSGTSWILQIALPEPDVVAVKHLTALLEVRTGAVGLTAGTTSMSSGYPTEAGAHDAMALVLAERPDARCSIEASPGPGDLVECPTCEGSRRTGPADDRPCVMCAGSGQVRADVAGTILETMEMEREIDPHASG